MYLYRILSDSENCMKKIRLDGIIDTDREIEDVRHEVCGITFDLGRSHLRWHLRKYQETAMLGSEELRKTLGSYLG